MPCAPCCYADAGLRVGHRRETQTRGVWMWDRPVPRRAGGDPLAPPGAAPAAAGNASLLFFDTEGFESTGQSDAYDDRIFAFAAVVASTLVYNLAEAVRESDIEKLSFAVELAAAFFPRYNTPGNPCAPPRPLHGLGSFSLWRVIVAVWRQDPHSRWAMSCLYRPRFSGMSAYKQATVMARMSADSNACYHSRDNSAVTGRPSPGIMA